MGNDDAAPPGAGLVQVGHVEVEQPVLAGPGQPLAGLLAGRELRGTVPAEVIDRLPADGWRVISTRPASQHLGPAEVLAAPLPGRQGAWALVALARRDGAWIFSADPGPVLVYPGKAARRHGLRLTWPQPELRLPAGLPVQLTVNLHNSRPDVWRNHRDDSAYVAGWLLDPAGQRLQASPWIAYGHGASIPALQPGQIISLPVTLVTPDTGALPAGRYGLDAVLLALDLRSSPGNLVLR